MNSALKEHAGPLRHGNLLAKWLMLGSVVWTPTRPDFYVVALGVSQSELLSEVQAGREA